MSFSAKMVIYNICENYILLLFYQFRFRFFLGGDYEFSCTVGRDFYEIYQTGKGRKEIKPGWSTKNNLKIWETLRLPCCLRFKRIKYRTQDIQVSGGQCRSKNCSISITTTLPHHSEKLKLSITGYDPNAFHDDTMKRRILPHERKEMEEHLKQKTAYALRGELADGAMTDGDCIPSHIPNLNTLRVIKSKNQCPQQSNAALALYEARNIYVNCIQAIHIYPFAVFYSTPAQVAWYKKEFERKRSIISIDASGVGLRSPTDDNKYIFLYVLCANGEKVQIFTLPDKRVLILRSFL